LILLKVDVIVLVVSGVDEFECTLFVFLAFLLDLLESFFLELAGLSSFLDFEHELLCLFLSLSFLFLLLLFLVLSIFGFGVIE
jgi:hypothetical protein